MEHGPPVMDFSQSSLLFECAPLLDSSERRGRSFSFAQVKLKGKQGKWLVFCFDWVDFLIFFVRLDSVFYI